MINIGFLLAPSKGWLGGVNYFRNLFVAIDSAAAGEFKVLAFLPASADPELVHEICHDLPTVTVVRTRLLERRSLPWLLWRLSKKLTGSDFWAGFYLRRYQVAVFSHSSLSSSALVKTVNWIPDFQHLHLPAFFSADELAVRDQSFRELAQGCDALVLSSQTAADDFQRFSPQYSAKAAVLRFVSQVPEVYWDIQPHDEAKMRARYGIEKPYVYLPNQFWQHKNHMVVFEAVSLLKQQGVDMELVCTGSMTDYRNKDYMAALTKRIATLGISDCVKLLGIVPYADVYALMKFSACVVNPSRFEGWSSTVEECKSVGKRLVLSDIPVHREQTATALFFSPDDAAGLALLLQQVLADDAATGPEAAMLKSALAARTRDFGRAYLEVIRSVLMPLPQHKAAP